MTSREWANERPWVFWPALILLAAVALCIALWMTSRDSREQAGKQSERLDTLSGLAEQARAVKVQATGRGRIARPGTLEWPKVRELAQQQGIAEDQRHLTSSRKDRGKNVTEQMVDVTIKNINREPLAHFLKSVEDMDPAIRTKSLQVTLSNKIVEQGIKTPVDAKAQFSAYESDETVATQPE